MSLEELYNWQGWLREKMRELGYWQSLALAMYSLGMVLARQSAPSKVSEKLGRVGKPDSVQRRLERFIDNVRVNWVRCCVAWSAWVLERYEGERVILLVDETHLGWLTEAAVCRWPGGLTRPRRGRWAKWRSSARC